MHVQWERYRFVVEYESFFINDEPEYDVFDFNDACLVNFIAEVASICDTSTVPLDLKPLPESLKFAFLRDGEFLPLIIASNLSQDQEESC